MAGTFTGSLDVTLGSGEGLKDVDWSGKQDPYCVLKIGGREARSNTHTDGGTNPVWNQVFHFANVSNAQELSITVYDENLILRDVAIGVCRLPLRELAPGGVRDVRLPVITKKGKHRGDIICRLHFKVPHGGQMPTQPTAQQMPGFQAAGPSIYVPATPAGGPRPHVPQAYGNGPGSYGNGPNSYGNGMPPTPSHAMPPAASHMGGPSQSHVAQPSQPAPAPRPVPAPTPTARPPPGNWILPTYAGRDCWRDYEPGQVLGKGTYGTTYLAKKKDTGEKVAIKVISKRKLSTPEEVEDVQREVKIMHHLSGHPNVVQLKDVYEDRGNVCLVMELCSGGELFDAIIKRGTYTERDAARVMRTILRVVAHCHNMGVIHRDLKPENFLLSDKSTNAELKTADFGLSTFFQEDQLLTDIVGSAFYVAPEVLKRCYAKEADIWSCGVILYILLCGTPPFQGDKEAQIFHEVSTKPLDLQSHPWPHVSEPAKDCVRRMLVRDPRRRATASDILQHEWLRENGVASDNVLELEVLSRMRKLNGMNKLKKEALRVLSGSLPVDEISGFREMFMEIDKDKSGTITVEEFTQVLRKKGQAILSDDMQQIMAAADLNGDGHLDYEEFLAAMLNQAKLEQEEHQKKALDTFDLGNSGSIPRAELHEVLRSMHINDSQIQSFIDEVDKNGDGEIDCTELRVLTGAAAGITCSSVFHKWPRGEGDAQQARLQDLAAYRPSAPDGSTDKVSGALSLGGPIEELPSDRTPGHALRGTMEEMAPLDNEHVPEMLAVPSGRTVAEHLASQSQLADPADNFVPLFQYEGSTVYATRDLLRKVDKDAALLVARQCNNGNAGRSGATGGMSTLNSAASSTSAADGSLAATGKPPAGVDQDAAGGTAPTIAVSKVHRDPMFQVCDEGCAGRVMKAVLQPPGQWTVQGKRLQCKITIRPSRSLTNLLPKAIDFTLMMDCEPCVHNDAVCLKIKGLTVKRQGKGTLCLLGGGVWFNIAAGREDAEPSSDIYGEPMEFAIETMVASRTVVRRQDLLETVTDVGVGVGVAGTSVNASLRKNTPEAQPVTTAGGTYTIVTGYTGGERMSAGSAGGADHDTPNGFQEGICMCGFALRRSLELTAAEYRHIPEITEYIFDPRKQPQPVMIRAAGLKSDTTIQPPVLKAIARFVYWESAIEGKGDRIRCNEVGIKTIVSKLCTIQLAS